MENDPLVGRQLGAYLIQARIGEGGMARVYKAYHERLRRDVAIKVILPQVAAEVGFRERFEREAQVIASLQHPNIVAVYDFGEIGNLTYLVMQYVGGGTLRDRLRSEQPLEPRQAAHYALQMARALHQAHKQGIVHRDVKPQNMLISATDPNQLLLSDFGIAKLFDSTREATLSILTPGGTGSGSDGSLTNVGQIVGTAEYMAPEQINQQPVDARTDVYALGIVLYQMLTGQVPFHSTTIQGLLYQHVYTVPRPLQEVNPNVPQVLAQITARAIEKAPQNRFQSAEAMAQAIEAVLTPITNPLSASLSTNYPPFGSSPGDAVTYLSHPPLAPSAHSYYGGQSAPTVASMGQSALPNTTGINVVAPPQARPAGKFRISTIALPALIALVVILAVLWPTISKLFPPGSGGTTQQAAPFTENFQKNDRGWPNGQWGNGHLIASFANTGYTIDIDGGVTNLDYFFPHPAQRVVGTLPDNFTLSADITQTKGGTDAVYGIAFNLTQNADATKVYCYAFVIDGKGDYEVWRFDSDAPTIPQKLWQGQNSALIHTGLNQDNTLQAKITGNNLSFEANNQAVPVGRNQATTVADTVGTPFKGGLMALVVSGPNTSFTVKSMQLAIP